MKRNKLIYDRWLRLLFLSFVLLVGGGGWMAWGQGTSERKINLQYSNEGGYYKHDSVFVETKVIYVEPGKGRELFIPELRISIVTKTKNANNHRYNWYVHWYVKSKKSSKGQIAFKTFTTTKEEAMLQGGEWTREDNERTYTTTDCFVNVQNEDGGLVWSKRLKEYFKDPKGYGMDASTITYTAESEYSEGDTVYCDVSTYQDGSVSSATSTNGTIGTYTEPTLTKRTKYIIKNCKECIDKYKEEQKPIKFDYPAIRNAMNYDNTGSLSGGNLNRTINFSMPSLPDNYFWEKDGKTLQGKCFQYKIENVTTDYQDFHLTTRKSEGKDVSLNLQQTQRIPKNYYNSLVRRDITVHVRARSETGEFSDDLAIFIFHPLEGVGFEIEKSIKENDNRYPRRNKERYELIGSVDFDLGEPITNFTNEIDNIANKPFGYFSENQTTYGFWNKDIFPLLRTTWGGDITYFSSSNQNMYGLFRSAKYSFTYKGADDYINYSKNDSFGSWNYRYMFPVLAGKDYNLIVNSNGGELYDRTYYISTDEKDPINKKNVESGKNLTPKYGHFYYVDASNEPGTVVEVPINGTLCPNTEITVTAWLADMTRANWVPGLKDYPLAPNLNILFKGKTGEEKVILHRFTTGDALVDYSNNGTVETDGEKAKYNAYLMQWQQLYYTFVLENNVEYEKYYLEIQNNEPHTDGADYAIDDIRIFRTIPKVSLVQADDPCDLGTKFSKVKFVTDYDILLANMGLKRDGVITNSDVNTEKYPEYENQTMALLKKYLAEHSEAKPSDYKKIVYMIYDPQNTEFPIRIKYNGKDSTYFRVSYLATSPEKMEWTGNFTYDENNYRSGEDVIISSTTISLGDGTLEGGKEYIARVFVRDVPLLEKYEAYLKEKEEKGSSSILTSEQIQEVFRLYSLEHNVCALTGRFEIIPAKDFLEIKTGDTTIDSPEKMENGKKYELTGNLSYYQDDDQEGKPQLLENAVFDWFFGSKEEFNAPNAIEVDGIKYSIYEALREYHNNNIVSSNIKDALNEKYGIATTTNHKATLTIGQRIALEASSVRYTMASDFQNLSIYTPAQQDWGSDIRYCNEPIYKDLGVVPPTIEPGDPDVPDPKDPEDPDPETPTDPKDPEDNQPDDYFGKYVRSVRVGLVQIQDMEQNNGTLRIPIHYRDDTELTFYPDETNKNITVCKTSDPERELLIGKAVATLEKLIDDKKTGIPEWDKNYFQIEFQDVSVNSTQGFREGFWYMVDIPYKVSQNESTTGKVQKGSMKLTLKIVPEYVTWVGSVEGMHNWNNDGPNHWRRSNDTELYTTNVANKNGDHQNAYTPMRFTKVTVAGDNATAYAAYPHLYQLSKRTTDPKALLNMAPANMDKTIGAATKNIEYDLLADPDYERELFGSVANPDKATTGINHNYSCVRFYGNTCDDIYIKPQSEILHTEYLTYDTAHVDYEMEPNRWYMLASPLKGVVSGDMYLPTGTGVGQYARQETPAFSPITYGDNTYTRWDPAVYMRGWDKTTATVVRPGTGSNNQVNYGIKGSWSNLYNDVDVPFIPGTGFSVGTKTNNTTNKVLFRLPKADNEYTYYGSTNGSGDETTLTHRTGNGRFYISPDEKGRNAVTSCSVSSTGGMFGNPFMSHLDMEKFLNDKSQNTYYIMTSTGTTTHILGDEYSLSTGDADPKLVAPLQSFIVKDMTEATFTTDMIAKAPATGKPGLRSATSSLVDEPLPQLRITATRDGVRNTAVVAGLVTASDSYVEGEDAALLINEEVAAPQVYTLAGNQMTAINVTPELSEIPLGIYGKDATPVELSFKVSGAMKNVKLVDKQTGKRYDVTDGLTLTVPGNTSGRYVLNGSIATSNEIVARNRIIFYNSAPGRIDISSVDPLNEVTVYDVSGRALRTLRNLNTPTTSVDHLAPGIYVVRAESGSQVVSEKVEVK